MRVYKNDIVCIIPFLIKYVGETHLICIVLARISCRQRWNTHLFYFILTFSWNVHNIIMCKLHIIHKPQRIYTYIIHIYIYIVNTQYRVIKRKASANLTCCHFIKPNAHRNLFEYLGNRMIIIIYCVVKIKLNALAIIYYINIVYLI